MGAFRSKLFSPPPTEQPQQLLVHFLQDYSIHRREYLIYIGQVGQKNSFESIPSQSHQSAAFRSSKPHSHPLALQSYFFAVFSLPSYERTWYFCPLREAKQPLTAASKKPLPSGVSHLSRYAPY